MSASHESSRSVSPAQECRYTPRAAAFDGPRLDIGAWWQASAFVKTLNEARGYGP